MPRCASHMMIITTDYSPSMASAMNARNLLEYWSGSAVLIPSTLDPYLTVLAALAVIFLTPGKNKSSWSLRDRHFCSPSGSQKIIIFLFSLKRNSSESTTLTCIEQKKWPQHWVFFEGCHTIESAEYCAIYWWGTITEKLVNYVTIVH